jgi:hypothetical protein
MRSSNAMIAMGAAVPHAILHANGIDNKDERERDCNIEQDIPF